MNIKNRKSMKALVLGLSLLGSVVFGQENNTPRPPKDDFSPRAKFKQEHWDHIKRDFNLSDKQWEEVRKVFEKHKQEWEKDRKAFMEKSKKHREQLKKDLAKYLTPEQRKKWEEQRKNFNTKQPPRIEEYSHRNKQRWEDLQKDFKLSEEQQKEIKNFLQEQREALKNKLQNTLTPDQYKQWQERNPK